ncbi:MAG TPA: hypothetical protein VFA15_04945, partial [Nitrososphaera sp.]|nr:hypothetical protein [Nitrososphaera sp.]
MLLAPDIAYEKACLHVAQEVQRRGLESEREIARLVKEASAIYGLSTIPRREDILRHLPEGSAAGRVLMVKPV